MKTVPVPPLKEMPSTRVALQHWRPIWADQVLRPRGFGARMGARDGTIHQKQGGGMFDDLERELQRDMRASLAGLVTQR
jgi:hypothetical protein